MLSQFSTLDATVWLLDQLQQRRWLSDLARAAVRTTLIGGRLPLIHRGLLGARALELHELVPGRGELRLGGVSEVLIGAAWLEFLRQELGEITDDAGRADLLYRVGQRGARWEVEQMMATMSFVPEPFRKALDGGTLLDDVRRDPQLAALLRHVIREVARLIVTEGGWGRVEEYDFLADPIRVSISSSAPARQSVGADGPVCHIMAGAIAGQLEALTANRYRVTETRCAAQSATPELGVCRFEAAATGD